jgi:transposase InsO family protein
MSLARAREALTKWKDNYNNVRTHSALRNLPLITSAKRSVPAMQRGGSLRNASVASPSLTA